MDRECDRMRIDKKMIVNYIQICYYVVDTYGGKTKEKRPPKRPFIHTHCVTARRGVLSNTFI